MVRIALRLAACVVACAGAAACDAPQRWSAAQDVSAFLASVQADDKAVFEAHLDRKALRGQLRGQITKAAAGAGLSGPDVDAFLGGQAGDVIVDQIISPASFRIAWKRSGAPTDHAPSAVELVPLIRLDDSDHACLHDLKHPDGCILRFQDEDGTWKLTGIEATSVQVAQAAGPSAHQ